MNEFIASALNRVFAQRPKDAHKGIFGQTVIIGGCLNFVGAPKFSAHSAAEFGRCSMLCGTGTSVLAVPDFLAEALYDKVDFSAIYPLRSYNGYIKFDGNEISKLMRRATSFAIGMGAGEGECGKIVKYILENGSQKIVIDADALRQCRDMNFKHRAVLTPHIGEMGELTGLSADRILEAPDKICLEYAKEHACVVVLKSATSYISDGKSVVENTSGNCKLSKGGSGDVLSGIIAALASFNDNIYDAAVCGAYMLGRCAELSDVNEFSHLPTDVIDNIPKVIDEILSFVRIK